MKNIFLLLLFSGLSSGLFAQNATDTTMIVNGVCGMCEATIEKAAKLEGVSHAEWDVKTLVLSLKFDAQKVSLTDINKSIVASGYDTEFDAATDSSYYKLDPCCYYRDPNNSHKKDK